MATKHDDPTLEAALNDMGAEGFDPNAEMGAEPTTTDDTPADTGTGTEPAQAAEPDIPEIAKGDVVVPDEPATDTDPDDDPLAGTQPFQYTLDGQARIFDAILEIPGQGGLIPPDKIEQVRNVFAYAEKAHLEREQLQGKLAQMEQALYTKNGDNELHGTEAFQHVRGELERTLAGGNVIWAALQNPKFVTALGFAMQQGDEESTKELLDTLRKDMTLAVLQTERTMGARLSAPSPEAQATQKTQAVSNAIATIARQYQGLTPDDVTEANTVFGPLASALVRPATAQDVAKWPGAGFKAGDLIVDRPQMEAFFKARADFRSGQAKAEQDRQARATAAGKAQSFNRGQQNGRTPAKSAGHTPAPVAKPTERAKVSRAAAWNEPLAAALDELGIPPA
jgi:hypothetical protein